jgi:hypothetical protein
MQKPGNYSDPIPGDDPHAVFREVCRLVAATTAQPDLTLLSRVFADVVRLFRGHYPGYQKCKTRYHNLKHTTDCLLAMARLLHGASLNGLALTDRDVVLGLTAALFHDTGYIQGEDDLQGTGAKYTLVHVGRSVAFMEKYFRQAGFSASDLDYCRCCVHCTGLEMRIKDLWFESACHQEVGWMLGTADLLGQMADHAYLTKLPFLYREFKEARVPGFESELDLLRKTPVFWDFTLFRLASELGNVDRYMLDHFREWYGIDRDLNRESIEGNIAYLKFVLANHESEYRKYLHQGSLFKIFRSLEKFSGPEGYTSPFC